MTNTRKAKTPTTRTKRKHKASNTGEMPQNRTKKLGRDYFPPLKQNDLQLAHPRSLAK